MFCFQCEQTAKCTGCTGTMGVCGKRDDTAQIQDQLTGALIGLARATDGNEHMVTDSTAAVVVEGLFATLTNVNFDNEALLAILPAFLSPNVVRFLVEKFHIAPITTPEEDLKAILG